MGLSDREGLPSGRQADPRGRIHSQHGIMQGQSLILFIMAVAASMQGCSSHMLPSRSEEPQKVVSENSEQQFLRLRERMVSEQLQARDVKDTRVLAAMRKVPRHVFVPDALVDSAYDDNPLPLILGQTISQPYIVGYMTQAMELRGPERVLEIGTGSGYQAAVLAELASEVYTIEILPELAAKAQSTLDALGYRNIRIRCGDGYVGWPDAAPFDRILVTAAPDHVPQPLVDQLKPGGKMIIPVGSMDQDLVLIEKGPQGISRRSTIPVRFVPMTGQARRKR
jgi:protein-L-isoaspartate(D-aspartate) O-methyltransferase